MSLERNLYRAGKKMKLFELRSNKKNGLDLCFKLCHFSAVTDFVKF